MRAFHATTMIAPSSARKVLLGRSVGLFGHLPLLALGVNKSRMGTPQIPVKSFAVMISHSIRTFAINQDIPYIFYPNSTVS
jgi:hypothetical protein